MDIDAIFGEIESSPSKMDATTSGLDGDDLVVSVSDLMDDKDKSKQDTADGSRPVSVKKEPEAQEIENNDHRNEDGMDLMELGGDSDPLAFLSSANHAGHGLLDGHFDLGADETGSILDMLNQVKMMSSIAELLDAIEQKKDSTVLTEKTDDLMARLQKTIGFLTNMDGTNVLRSEQLNQIDFLLKDVQEKQKQLEMFNQLAEEALPGDSKDSS
mmetsp:Transcript_22342/g.38565  ORF Transcript_22342/g.38565 Transcript_22342/m.38565 type:complete len:214 (+) Transcript_22342:24-665(+)